MAPAQSDIQETLASIEVPGGDLVSAGMVREIEIEGPTVRVTLVCPASLGGTAPTLKAAAERALLARPDVDSVEVQVRVMAPPQQVEGVGAPQEDTWDNRIRGVRHVVPVASGKGGVGKSTVAANLALALAQEGRRVGLLDADIYGPSQQLMMASGEKPMANAQGRLRPLNGPGGVQVMSLGFIIDTDQPVIWRGPLLMKAMEQLIGDVDWGELDELVVDLPPGTGDVVITLCQKLKLAGAVIVTTPQDVALIDARKALHMFHKMEEPVLGIVENMSGFTCPQCGHHEPIFGQGGGRRTAEELGVPFLGSIPLDPAIVAGGDTGRPVVLERPDSPTATAFREIAGGVIRALENS
jgi:ATP-binding protein involved in chromosome partitioning